MRCLTVAGGIAQPVSINAVVSAIAPLLSDCDEYVSLAGVSTKPAPPSSTVPASSDVGCSPSVKEAIRHGNVKARPDHALPLGPGKDGVPSLIQTRRHFRDRDELAIIGIIL